MRQQKEEDRIGAMTLDREDVARLFGVSSRTISRLRSKGAIPAPVRIGGLVRWRTKDILQFLDKLRAD